MSEQTTIPCTPGALIFQRYSDSSMKKLQESDHQCNAQLVAALRDGTSTYLDNVGVMVEEKTKCFVIEVQASGIVQTPLDDFIKRSEGGYWEIKTFDAFQTRPKLLEYFLSGLKTQQQLKPKPDCRLDADNTDFSGPELVVNSLNNGIQKFLETNEETDLTPINFGISLACYNVRTRNMDDFVQNVLKTNATERSTQKVFTADQLYCTPGFSPQDPNQKVNWLINSHRLFGCTIPGDSPQSKWEYLQLNWSFQTKSFVDIQIPTEPINDVIQHTFQPETGRHRFYSSVQEEGEGQVTQEFTLILFENNPADKALLDLILETQN